MIKPQKPVINLITIFNRFTALIYIYISAVKNNALTQLIQLQV